MRNHVNLRCLGLGIAAILGLLGCSAGPSDPGPMTEKPDLAPDFPEGTGQAPKGTAAYAPGPYGISKGSIIANYHFIGYANAQLVSGSLQPIELADFYNPHADDPNYAPEDPSQDDRLYPAGSPYGEGTPKPKALLIDVASVWCGPCNTEAKSVLPGLHVKYKPCGGEFLLQLADGATPGIAATQLNLYNWTYKYKVDFPATIDPTYKLGALFDANAFPANMIIDTRTMTIKEVIAGVPDATFWSIYAKTLNDPACPN
jgi:hypothetical protein